MKLYHLDNGETYWIFHNSEKEEDYPHPPYQDPERGNKWYAKATVSEWATVHNVGGMIATSMF